MLFVVDAQDRDHPGDEEVAEILRAARKPVFLLANKIDDPARTTRAFEFHRLGLGDPIPLSALHGHGTGDLLDAIVARLPGSGPAQIGEEAIRVAILGRPNVGKSSLLNAILGEDRVIVSDVPGTTRDTIDTVFKRGETTFVLVDTAGLRRKRKPAAGDRVLLGAARPRRRRPRRRRARPGRRDRGARRPGPRGRGRGTQGELLDARRPLQVGYRRDQGRGRAAANRSSACASARRGHRLGEDGPRRLAPARPRRGAVREAHRAASRRRS